ncbi:hypothetical protein CONCODRAFT_2117 [Conidiobolus coronatus NRRL 28638]|uniref:G-protein coupled receptors family 1 profile domain-containing protein n=1 Tax=Conidiobolus coronatus (strain ATCC 28846 / CBS 209.66 / NRRL 28638) TaxID=796925 RepID=A0A137PIH2_CONC2|nr:hypothetical protein CONCODRAFT_2117 [Conidiobolus coronatus NRRL 28638]|eukprot:KXN74789.1 hypothetical protein CONCODRAFT_2117 [Conidiobolus coronatus NRRL 28638]
MILITLIDLAWSIQKIIYDILILIYGTEIFYSEGNLCQLSALTLGVTFRCSIWSLATLSMIRFIHGCLRVRAFPVFWFAFLGLNICFNVSMGIYSMMERSAKQNTTGVMCASFQTLVPTSQYILLFNIVYLTLGSLIIVLCYFGSTVYINQSIRYMVRDARMKRDEELESNLIRQRWVLFINFGIISIVYLLAFYPPVISYILKHLYGHKRGFVEDALITVWGQLPCLFNSILTIYLHPETNLRFFNFCRDIYDFYF